MTKLAQATRIVINTITVIEALKLIPEDLVRIQAEAGKQFAALRRRSLGIIDGPFGGRTADGLAAVMAYCRDESNRSCLWLASSYSEAVERRKLFARWLVKEKQGFDEIASLNRIRLPNGSEVTFDFPSENNRLKYLAAEFHLVGPTWYAEEHPDIGCRASRRD